MNETLPVGRGVRWEVVGARRSRCERGAPTGLWKADGPLALAIDIIPSLTQACAVGVSVSHGYPLLVAHAAIGLRRATASRGSDGLYVVPGVVGQVGWRRSALTDSS